MSLSYRRLSLLAVGVALVAATAGCGSNSLSTDPAPPVAPSNSAGGESLSQAALTNANAAEKLCDSLRPELSNWRVQGPTLGKIGFNLAVQGWAGGQGGAPANLLVAQDKNLIDRVTQSSCPDVRRETIEALKIPNLAAALLGV